MNRYNKMTTEDFDRHLLAIVNNESAESLIAIPGVYEILAEHFNNEVLDAWEQEREETQS